MPATGPNSAPRGAYTRLQPESGARLNPVQKLLRFLGFSRLKVLYEAIPKLPARPDDLRGDDKELSDRDVAPAKATQHLSSAAVPRLAFHDDDPASVWSDINRHYCGFRANSVNINRLYHDILQSRVACRPGESDEQYRERVALTLIACGLAGSHNGQLRGVHSLNRPLSQKQLQTLQENLDRPFHEMVREVNNGQSKARLRLDREIDRYPRLLVEVCARMPMATKQDLLFVSRHSHRYLVSGEGQKLLESTSFPGAVEQRMADILPGLPSEGIDSDVLEQAKRFRETCERTDATDNTGKIINGIRYVQDKSEQDFDPDSPEHRCLVMIQGLAMGWQSYCDGRSQKAFFAQDDQDETMAESLLRAKQTLNNLWLAMSHNIMFSTKGFRTNFDREKYQQVVLRSDDKTVYWNSDNVQPRGGWFDSKRFEPVSLPK